MKNENLLKWQSNRYIWVQLRNNGVLFGGARFLYWTNFHFAHVSMIIKVITKIWIVWIEYSWMNTIFYYLFSMWFWYYYLLTCETDNLYSFTASIVVRTCRIVRKRVPRYLHGYTLKWVFFLRFARVNSSVTIFINTLCNPKIRLGCQKLCVSQWSDY